MTRLLITAALPYANGAIHFGHLAGAYIPADCFARFSRLMGDEVLFLSGSDEYGVAISMSAELAGRSCQEHVDINHQINKTLFEKLSISFDIFSRTSTARHTALSHQFFLELLQNNYIEAKVTEQLYCEDDRKFYADRYVVGTCPKCGYDQARGDECTKCGSSFDAVELKSPKVKQSGAALTLRPTKHWFLELDKFQGKLQEWLATKNWKPQVANFAKGYLDEIHPRAITRDMSWGISVPLPDAAGKVLYVWFDAPIGYLSIAQEWAQQSGDSNAWKKFWCEEQTRLVQFVGKDNIPFHAVIFPAMLMGQTTKYKMVDELVANEFYNLEGRQFSKSDGWYVDLQKFLGFFSSELVRYALASTAPETQDSEFTWKDFQQRCNADLCGKLGNFVHRTLSFAQKACKGKIPAQHALEPIDIEFRAEILRLVVETKEAYANFKLRRACQLIMELAQRGNVYFDAKKPWVDAKQELTIPRLETTIHLSIECIKTLALIMSAVLPESSQKICHLLNLGSCPRDWAQWINQPLPIEQSLPVPEVLFQKIEDDYLEQAKSTCS